MDIQSWFKNKRIYIRVLIIVLTVLVIGGIYLLSVNPINEEKFENGEYSEGSCEVLEGDQADSCYYDLAKQNIDLGFCDFIEDEMKMGMCNAEVENLKNQPDKELAQCKKLEEEDLRNDCMTSLANAKREPEICENVTSYSEKNICYSQVAKEIHDANACNYILDLEQYDNCIYEITKIVNEAELCQRINEQDKQDECYRSVAIQTKTDELCEEIQDKNTKFNCQQVVATLK